jgi:hypothetical protein
MMRRSSLIAPLLLLPLAACQTTTASQKALSCPDVSVLADAASVVKFAPGTAPGSSAAAQSQVILTADMTPPVYTCDYDEEAHSGKVDLTLLVRLAPGAAAAQAAGTRLDMFASILAPDGTVQSKQTYAHILTADEVASRVVNEKVDEYPLSVAADGKPYRYRLLVGFQLSPEELAYERARHNQTSSPATP